jgi:hypothetical protein
VADSALRNWGKLSCCIRLSTLSAATVDSVWHLCNKIFFLFRDIFPHIIRGLSMEILWKFHEQSRSGVNCRVRLQPRRSEWHQQHSQRDGSATQT